MDLLIDEMESMANDDPKMIGCVRENCAINTERIELMAMKRKIRSEDGNKLK